MTTKIDNPKVFPPGDNALWLQGPQGKIEALASLPANATGDVVAIVCHPHSLFGGAMHNKVVYTIARALQELGVPTVRFNFRGVDGSEGAYDEGIGETEDAMAVMDWLHAVYPKAILWSAGFSFGSYVAARVAKKRTIGQLISIAPPVGHFAFTELPPFSCPWLVVQGDHDEIVDPSSVFNWLEVLTPAPQVIRMEGAGHFFHGRLVELRELLINALRNQLPQ